MSKKSITLERTYQADLNDVWELWTTKEGIESWWGPRGFTTEVTKLELKKGGDWHYTMTATGKEQVEFMKRANMPLSTDAKVNYTDVSEKKRLAYQHLADFIPGVTPYAVDTAVDFEKSGNAVKMTVTLQAMHDDVWTERSVMGWKDQLTRLDEALKAAA